MSEVIYNQKGSLLAPWVVKARKRNPQTDKWQNDDLSDVTAVKVSMKDAVTGTAVFTDQAGSVYDVANSLLSYDPVAGDVDTVAYNVLIFELSRAGGKPHILPSDESNKIYVRIWE